MVLQPVQAVALARTDFLACLYADGALANAMLNRLADCFRRQIAVGKDRQALTVRQRLIVVLRLTATGLNGEQMVIGMTHQDLAECVGASPAAVGRVLAELRREGFIVVGRKRIIIKKPLPAEV